MLKVGITGGIGSGKTTVCKIFESLGVPVYYADNEAKRLIEEHPRLVSGYKKLFGDEVYRNGKLNKRLVAKMIFDDSKLLNKVNALVHPVVREDFIGWVNKQRAPYVLEEAAVLLESGGHQFLDKVILVTAPVTVRIARVIKRDGVTPEEVLKRIRNQWPDEKRRRFCNYEVLSDDKHLVVPQILNIHSELLK
ncbi:MAG: dephospho-CoA kinase [Anaerophaga sp.]|nr:dephospho-CoA kinase [Anaerophaga sp.]MDK2841324.1 dephospho-CoA kinase [Anaerophaga sp.]MDN5290987.1 dephospho-CoA kinase [Anaerophaga sp.]